MLAFHAINWRKKDILVRSGQGHLHPEDGVVPSGLMMFEFWEALNQMQLSIILE